MLFFNFENHHIVFTKQLINTIIKHIFGGERMKEDIPVLLLKKLSLLPLQEVRLELSNELSKQIMDLSTKSYNKKILVILPLNGLETSPSVKDLPEIGVLTYIKSCIKLPSDNYRVVIQGLNRVKIFNYVNYIENNSILISSIKKLYIDKSETTEEIALKRKLIELTKKYIKINPESSNSIHPKINETESLDYLSDLIVSFINFPLNKKVKYMNEFDEKKRTRRLIDDLSIELEVIKLNNKLDRDIRIEFENEQKQFLIKAKIEKLKEELGVSNSREKEIEDYTNKIMSFNFTSSTEEKLLDELKKYDYTPVNSPDASVIRNYLDTVLSLPYKTASSEELNIKKIDKKLNTSHYGICHIKERIKDYAALKNINSELTSPVLCLIGPPGVGKSTFAMSISSALKRKFIKISVGGLNDSSELIGHRRTYLGASPGKIISGIKKSGVNNPVILVDEVDKMVKDYKGDPASVLLDILDINQNQTFIDNYIEEPFDLSSCLFILTANDISAIPVALKDRLEIMYIDSYTIYEKKDIAKDYLIPNICKKYKYKKIKLSDEIILFIINNYTLESGVRELERVLDKLIRNIIINKIPATKIDISYTTKVLGLLLYESTLNNHNVGTCNILGVSPLGGKIITVQSILVESNKGVTVTGNVGDCTKDSISVVINYLKGSKHIKESDIADKLLHINFNQDIPLKGSSGSLGVAISILSIVKNIKVDSKTAFSGKIDLYGNVLKVNSIKEKIITAYNSNINVIYLPKENQDDVKDIPEFILNETKIVFIESFDEVSKVLFKKVKKQEF